MKLTTLIIDDSKMQELLTLKMVNEHPNLSCIGSYNNPIEGLSAANALRPDIIILDVEMPELDGFTVLENLKHDCQVILYSTRSEFALSAFKYDHVKDYMTKPMKRPRFEKSIEKVMKNQLLNSKKELNLGTYFYSERLSLAS